MTVYKPVCVSGLTDLAPVNRTMWNGEPYFSPGIHGVDSQGSPDVIRLMGLLRKMTST